MFLQNKRMAWTIVQCLINLNLNTEKINLNLNIENICAKLTNNRTFHANIAYSINTRVIFSRPMVYLTLMLMAWIVSIWRSIFLHRDLDLTAKPWISLFVQDLSHLNLSEIFNGSADVWVSDLCGRKNFRNCYNCTCFNVDGAL